MLSARDRRPFVPPNGAPPAAALPWGWGVTPRSG